MNRFLYFSFFVLVTTITACQPKKDGKKIDTTTNDTLTSAQYVPLKRSKSIFLKEKLDVGVIQGGKGKEYIAYFNYDNQMNQPVVIEKVKASCGCLQVDYPREPIQSGQKGKVKVVLNLNRLRGHFRKSLLVYFNYTRPVLLSIIGEIDTNSSYTPKITSEKTNVIINP